MRRPAATDRTEREEGIIDALVGHIQLSLKGVQKLMQPARDDLLYVGIRQFRAQLAQALLGEISVHADRCA